MKKSIPKNVILVAPMVFLLFLAIVYQSLADNRDTLDLLQQGEPSAVRFEQIPGDYPSYRLWDSGDQFLGYGVIADASGYGGKIIVLTIVDETGIIKAVSIVEESETPLYLNKVLNSGFLERITGENIQTGISDVDMVSGATVSADAILTAVQKGTAHIGSEQLDMHIPPVDGFHLVWQDFATVVLLLLSVVCAVRGLNKMRPWLLVLAVLFIGFIMNYSLAYSNFISILAGNLPVFIERPIWYIMVIGILGLTLILGRNLYCRWMCPFGAVQEGIYRSLNLFAFNPSPELRAQVRKSRWPMLWLVAIIALLLNNPGIASYEPFSAFFDGSGNTAQWLIMLIVLLMSMAQMRFWCQFFCPVGTILDFTAGLRRKMQRFRTKTETEFSYDPESLQSHACAACREEKLSYTKQDKFYIFAISLVNILILGSLWMSYSM